MDKDTKRDVEKTLQYHFKRILLDTGTRQAIEERLGQLNNIWFQLSIPSIDILESVCRPIKIKMGNVFAHIARIVASGAFDSVEEDKTIQGNVTRDTVLEIDSIVGEYTTGEQFPSYDRDKSRILKAQSSGAKNILKRESVDLYLKDGKKTISFELKSGGKHDTTAAPGIKRRHLTRIAILNSELADCKVGLAYNPFGEDAEYKWSQMVSLFELHKELLVGKEFWNFIGQSESTYGELKEIFVKIGPPMECEAIEVINKVLEASPNNRNKVRLTYTKYKGIFEP